MKRIIRACAAVLIAAFLLPVATTQALYEVSDTDITYIAKALYGECRGVESKAERAAVVWCILNRLEKGSYGDTIRAVITAPYQFTGYAPDNPVRDSLRDLAIDVCAQWEREQAGEIGVGRTLPKEYLFFAGRADRRNHFRTRYDPELETDNEYWDWTLPDPYTAAESAAEGISDMLTVSDENSARIPALF